MLYVMKSKLILITLIFSPLFFVGCESNSVTGSYGDGEVISGKVNYNLLMGGDSFSLASSSPHLVCEGITDVADTGGYALDCSDQSGLGRGSCTIDNERYDFSFRWYAHSECKGAVGIGMYSNGEMMCMRMWMDENTFKIHNLKYGRDCKNYTKSLEGLLVH